MSKEQLLSEQLTSVQANLAEVEKAFEAYKGRAQAALKRMTREDSNIRRDQYEVEHQKLLELSEQISQLTGRYVLLLL